MPFTQIDIQEQITARQNESEEFKKLWNESREEYRLIGEFIALRKQEQLTQNQIAERTGIKQQVLSRMEKRENSPSLRMFCNVLQAMGYELQIVRRKDGTTFIEQA